MKRIFLVATATILSILTTQLEASNLFSSSEEKSEGRQSVHVKSDGEEKHDYFDHFGESLATATRLLSELQSHHSSFETQIAEYWSRVIDIFRPHGNLIALNEVSLIHKPEEGASGTIMRAQLSVNIPSAEQVTDQSRTIMMAQFGVHIPLAGQEIDQSSHHNSSPSGSNAEESSSGTRKRHFNEVDGSNSKEGPFKKSRPSDWDFKNMIDQEKSSSSPSSDNSSSSSSSSTSSSNSSDISSSEESS